MCVLHQPVSFGERVVPVGQAGGEWVGYARLIDVTEPTPHHIGG